MQCNFSGTKEHVSMETSTHGGRERERREREQQWREAGSSGKGGAASGPLHSYRWE